MVNSLPGEPVPSDLREAKRYLPSGAAEDLADFALRQLRARRRFTEMVRFYRESPCNMARTHLLATCAIALGRFCGYSASYDRLGEALSPVSPDGQPRTALWTAYVVACRGGRPLEVRDEFWLAAHMADFEAARQANLDQEFYAEAEIRSKDPTWQLLRQHMEVTLGARMIDRAAISGMVAYETAMAQSMAHGVGRLARAGGALLSRYAREAARALLLPAREPERGLLSYRRSAMALVLYTATAWTTSRTFRRGVRARDRGVRSEEDGWPLLTQVIGDRIGEIHPLINRFYTNPSEFAVMASLELHTLPARLWSRAATLLTGQGLFESSMENIPARFRVFRRADGSMHFIRELYCRDTLRVFDSDFVVRVVNGRPTLSEVFVDLGAEVRMEVTPLGDGGLRIESSGFIFRGVPMPALALQVSFETRVIRQEDDSETLEIAGTLQMNPASTLGRLLAYKILRRPRLLGRLRYQAHLLPSAVVDHTNTPIPTETAENEL